MLKALKPRPYAGMLQFTPFSDVRPAGDLRRRLALNYDRLQGPSYRFEAMVRASTAKEAPGDWLGRAMLSLSVLGQVLGSEPPYLEEILAKLPTALNARGYIGELHAAGKADENQVGGHNGFLRGLCEVYLWKRDPRALAVIRSVVSALMVPTRPLYADYPDHPLASLADGKPIGLTVKQDGVWVGLSTDIGTVFFTLDALTQAYSIEPRPDLRALIETMMARYAELDLQKIGAQTHATLSTLRGILRWWGSVDPRPEWLALVKDRYALYRDVAETEHFANYNWFNRPEWTEACAVVDSFLLSIELWRATGEADYLSSAHHVFFNALSFAQRPNGGFGCDRCVGADHRVELAPHPKIFEAPFCCTMRGSEGLARAAQANLVGEAKSRAIWSLFYFEGDSTLRLGPDEALDLQVVGDYPQGGRVTFAVTRSTVKGEVVWKFFVPPGVATSEVRVQIEGVAVQPVWADGFGSVTLSPAAGLRWQLDLPLVFRPEQAVHPAAWRGYHRFSYGPMLLAAERGGNLAESEEVRLSAEEVFEPLGSGRFRCVRTGTVLAPLTELTYRSEAAARGYRAQLLFPDLER